MLSTFGVGSSPLLRNEYRDRKLGFAARPNLSTTLCADPVIAQNPVQPTSIEPDGLGLESSAPSVRLHRDERRSRVKLLAGAACPEEFRDTYTEVAGGASPAGSQSHEGA